LRCQLYVDDQNQRMRMPHPSHYFRYNLPVGSMLPIGHNPGQAYRGLAHRERPADMMAQLRYLCPYLMLPHKDSLAADMSAQLRVTQPPARIMFLSYSLSVTDGLCVYLHPGNLSLEDKLLSGAIPLRNGRIAQAAVSVNS